MSLYLLRKILLSTGELANLTCTCRITPAMSSTYSHCDFILITRDTGISYSRALSSRECGVTVQDNAITK